MTQKRQNMTWNYVIKRLCVGWRKRSFVSADRRHSSVFQPANVKHQNGVYKRIACDVDSDFPANFKLTRVTKERRGSDVRITVYYEGDSDPDVFLSPNYGVTGHYSMQEIIPHQGRVQADFNEHGIEPMFSFKLPNYPLFQYMLLLRNLTADVPNSENIVELGFRVDPGRELTYNLGQDVTFSVSLDSTTSKHYFFSDDVYLRQDVENSQIKFKKLWTRDEGYPLQCLGQTRQNDRAAIHYRLKTDGDPKGLIQITADATCFSGCLVTWVLAMTYIRFYPSYMYGPFPPYYIGFTEPHPPWQKPYCFAHWKCELFCAAVGDGPTMMNIKKVTNYGYEQRNVQIGKLLDFYISARVVLRQATVDDSEAQFCLRRHSFVFQPANVKANFKLTRVTKEPRGTEMRITIYYEGARNPEEIIPYQDRVQADLTNFGSMPMFCFKLPGYPFFQFLLLLRNLTEEDVPNSENIADLGFRIDPGRDLTYDPGQDVNFSVSLDSTTSKYYFFQDDVYVRQDVENSQIKFKRLWVPDKGYPLQRLGRTNQDGREARHYRLNTTGSPTGLIKITADATCFSGCLVVWVAAMTYIRFYPSYMSRPFPAYYIGFAEPHPPWQKPFCFSHWKCEIFCAAVGDGPTLIRINKVTSNGTQRMNVQIGKQLDFFIFARIILSQATVDDSEAEFCLCRQKTFFVFQPANVKHRNGVCKGLACDVDSDFLANFKLTRVTKERRGSDVRITVYYEGDSDPEVFLSPNYPVTRHHSMQEIIPQQGRVQADFNKDGIKPMFSFKLPNYPFFEFLLYLRNLTVDGPNSENIVELGFRVDPGRELTYDRGQDVNFSVSLDSTTSKHYFFDDDVYLRQNVENSQIKFKKLWTRDEGYPLQCLGQTKQNGRVASHYRLKTDGDPKGLIQITASPTCFSGCLVTWVAAMTYIRFYPSYMYGPFPPYYIGFTEPHPPWQKLFCFAHWKCELFCAAVGDGPTMMNIKKVTNYGL
ncbi:hypothetical protein BaRGS_00021531 [Batillaria attramentaria]|uniref:Uncharacterized protein n=1 Tax=Batillaria attramentaria TaxID=370345 RepID=A0ABD0KJB6_9CAEN